MGIAIRLPAKSENLRRTQDPLEAIARAYRIRIPRITLTDKCWKKDSAPILAYTIKNDRSIALIPNHNSSSLRTICPTYGKAKTLISCLNTSHWETASLACCL